MRFRRLRIAWSAGWGIFCVLLIFLWMRSYTVYDITPFGTSANGLLIVGTVGLVSSDDGHLWGVWHDGAFGLTSLTAKGLSASAMDSGVSFPHWSAILISSILAAAPWIHRVKRFSLRALLLATTLLAVVLGLAVWAAGK